MSIEATFQENSLTATFQGTGPAQTGEHIAGLLDTYLGNTDWRTGGLRQLGTWTVSTNNPPNSNEISVVSGILRISDVDSDGNDWSTFFNGLPIGSWVILTVDEDNQTRYRFSGITDQTGYFSATIDQTETKGLISNGAEVSVSVDVAGGGGAVDSVFGRTGAVTAQSGDYTEGQISNKKEYIVVAASDETSDLSSGADKATFRMPFAATVTEVRADVNTAPVGSTLIVDINESGTSILSTKITIDDGETTSETAATPPVISDASIAENAEISIDIDQVGSSTPGAGLRITIIVER